jgi:hypothetical protein
MRYRTASVYEKIICHSKQPTVGCFRWFLRGQCFASVFVASPSHAGSVARTTISTAAKYFGAFGAGLPNGFNSFAATKRVIGRSSVMKITFSVCFGRFYWHK